jgi:hypothetical protein
MDWKRNLAAVTLAITGAGLVGGTSALTATQMPWRATAMAGADLAALSWQAKPTPASVTELPWRPMPWRTSAMDVLWRISSRHDMAGTTAAKDLENED